MNFLYLLGLDIFSVSTTDPTKYTAIDEIAVFLNNNLVSFTIALCVLGAIFSIILAAAMVKEEDPKKAADYKRKMIGMVVTILIVILLVWILGWVITSLDSIRGIFEDTISF